jgi:hypothetical protein
MTPSKLLVALLVAATGCGSVTASPDDAMPQRPVCGAQPIEVLPNGDFDAASPAWVQEMATPVLLCGAPTITPFSGTKAACLGGADGTTLTLSQQVPLPAGAKMVTLSGVLCISTEETATVDNDVLHFDLLDGATVISSIAAFSNQQGAAQCQFTAFSRSAAVTGDPATATLRLRSTLDAAKITSFFIDSLSLKVSCTP